MKSNVAGIEGVARVVIGAPLLLLEPVSPWLTLLGTVLVATGIVGWCPLYALLGIATNEGGRTPSAR